MVVLIIASGCVAAQTNFARCLFCTGKGNPIRLLLHDNDIPHKEITTMDPQKWETEMKSKMVSLSVLMTYMHVLLSMLCY